jgi:hypothetical protein
MARKRGSAASAGPAKAHRARAEPDVRGLLIRVNSEGLRALRQLALDEDTTMQSLATEALNNLLKPAVSSQSLKIHCTKAIERAAAPKFPYARRGSPVAQIWHRRDRKFRSALSWL